MSDSLVLRILRAQLEEITRHAPAARTGHDPEAVHDMRVATRRLRAALRVFADILPEDAGALNDELRWIADTLGAVRDLDVQLEHVRARGRELCEPDALQPYVAWLQAARERCHRDMLLALDEARYGALVEHLRGAAETWAVADQDAHAAARVRYTMKRLRKAAKDLRPTDAPAAFHRVRIRAKRFRYTVEFHVPLFGGPAETVVRRTVELQDVLGELQDGVVSQQHVQEALRLAGAAWSARTTFALGRLVQRDEERSRELREQGLRVYGALRRKPWRKLRRALECTTISA